MKNILYYLVYLQYSFQLITFRVPQMLLFLQVQAISALCPEHFKDAAAPQLLL